MPLTADDRERIERELARLKAEDEATLEHRYRMAFPADPVPMMHWHYRDDGAQLDALKEAQ